ncbi:hypothetical protein [Nibribacter koreensis]|uniref:Uncharacterized protein n=1 Tax=Nibribacter koreensis TaxID=1084519 RepID=A0ABP8FL23_9BACT
MVALVYFDLSEDASFTYQKPLLTWLKKQYPNVTTFDLDKASEPMLFHHAQRLLQGARFCLLFLKTGQKQILGPEMQLLDALFKKTTGVAVAICGQHAHLETVLKARPAIAFAQATLEEDLHPFLASFFELKD